jgi:hypothetical protein
LPDLFVGETVAFDIPLKPGKKEGVEKLPCFAVTKVDGSVDKKPNVVRAFGF